MAFVHNSLASRSRSPRAAQSGSRSASQCRTWGTWSAPPRKWRVHQAIKGEGDERMSSPWSHPPGRLALAYQEATAAGGCARLQRAVANVGNTFQRGLLTAADCSRMMGV